MRRSLYHRTVLAGSTLYRGAERRQSTLPTHARTPLHSTLLVPVTNRDETRPATLRFSCSDSAHGPDRPEPRPYRSTGDELDISDFPIRIKTDLSADSFRISRESESSSSYVSPRSHRSVSYAAEELELDVFSRQSSEGSEDVRRGLKQSRERLHSCLEEPVSDSSRVVKQLSTSDKTDDSDFLSEAAMCTAGSEMDTSFIETASDGGHGEGYEFALKQFESFDRLCLSPRGDISGDDSPCSKPEVEFLRHGLIQWKNGFHDEEDTENLAPNRDQGGVAFRFDARNEREKDPESPSVVKEPFNVRRSLFPITRKPGNKVSVEIDEIEEETERDEGFVGNTDGEELISSELELRRREAFRKERSLDSDETSGFVSKHSSETTDLSSRLSSTQFSTKHLSEPLSVSSACAPGDMSQHLSEPSDFGSRTYLSVEADVGPAVISKKRELFRKSKRLKHFNLRRIDDTDNDSYDSDRPAAVPDEPVEPPSARLKEEVGLPKHLSRDSSVDRYGLYKSRSEKTITSFESDRLGQGRLQDFEAFCEAVAFTRQPLGRPKAASAEETDVGLSEPEQLTEKSRTKVRRRSKSKQDLTKRLHCLLL